MKISEDRGAQILWDRAQRKGVETIWERYQVQQPQCGFGELGICCRNCLQGPCRIDPFGQGPQSGICGAGRDTIVARNLLRAIAAGAAAHSGHAKHLAHVLKKWAEGTAPQYPVRDENKLRAVAARLGLAEHAPVQDLALELANQALLEFSEREQALAWTVSTLPPDRIEALARAGAVPQGIDSAIAESLHRSTMGVDSDPLNLLLAAVKTAIADYAGSHLATDLADILFGTPQPVTAHANLGVLDEFKVNIALHGHNPALSDLLVRVAGEMVEEARTVGAEGINLVGMCCSGNEILLRHGVSSLAHSVSQELPMFTGALDAVVVDYQCVYPSLPAVAECTGTKLITTMEMAKIPGAQHIGLDMERVEESARYIIRQGFAAFQLRKGKTVFIPEIKHQVVAGFSLEAITKALAKLNQQDPLQPLIENIVQGNIQGVALLAGCNNVKVTQDENFLALAKELARRDILLLATGCGAGTFARHGMLTPAATKEYAGPGLKAVLTAIGEANGLGGPLPLILHLGSCVDNSRAVDLAVAVSQKLGVELSRTPVVVSAPEYTTEKALAIGTYAVALGLTVHLGLVPPVAGSDLVAGVLTGGIKELFGGCFIVETNPLQAAEKLDKVIQDRRNGLGLRAR